MTGWDRERAVDRVETLIQTVESETMPVPVREIWVFGDVALGLDPVERLDIYLTKDILLHDESGREQEFIDSHGVKSVGKTVRADWAAENVESLRTTASGHAAPEKCLGAHLVTDDEPIHLEICNASFEDNVTQRLSGALARENYEEVLDPRGACLWIDGERSAEAFEKLRAGEFIFPTLAESLEMLGADEADANTAADVISRSRSEQAGSSIRGDVV